MINETGTMTGGGGKPRGGRMCLGSAAPRALDTREAAAELASAERELSAGTEVSLRYFTCGCKWYFMSIDGICARHACKVAAKLGRHSCIYSTREGAMVSP